MWRYIVPVLCSAGFFLLSVQQLKPLPKQKATSEIEVALPLFVQVGLTGGDRYLAANIAAIRALVTDTQKMRRDEMATLARVQVDVSWLNPRHEDNFYSAAAILPWHGYVDATQIILERAMRARPYDYQPGFYYAFNLREFKRDYEAAAMALRQTALGLPAYDEGRLMLENLSAKWLDRSSDLDAAILVLEDMAARSNLQSFRRYLLMRVDRLRLLQSVRAAAQRYTQKTGRKLRDLQELVAAGLLPAVPMDPFGLGFILSPEGEVFLKN